MSSNQNTPDAKPKKDLVANIFDKLRNKPNTSGNSTNTNSNTNANPSAAAANIGLSFHKALINNSTDDFFDSSEGIKITLPSPSENKQTNDAASNDSLNNSTQSSSNLISTASKLSSAIDDFLMSSSDKEPTSKGIDSVKKKLLLKKKSFELSFENMRTKNRNSSNQSLPKQSATASNILELSESGEQFETKIQSEKLFTSASDYSLVEHRDQSQISLNESLTETNTSITIATEADNKMSADNENEKSIIENKDAKNKEIKPNTEPLPQISSEENRNSFGSEPTINTQQQRNVMHQNSFYDKLNKYKWKILFLSIFLTTFISKPQLINGFIMGAIVSSSILYVYYKIKISHLNNALMVQPEPVKPNSDGSFNHKILVCEKSDKNFDGVYKGWMNELRERYSPDTYCLNKTHSVFVSLDGTKLRLQSTNIQVAKRALVGENNPTSGVFTDQKIYDLKDCNVSLLPIELIRKRYWSKKYPICLKNVKLLSKSKCEATPSKDDSKSSSKDDANKSLNSDNQLPADTLIIFARADREKEYWFNLFRQASKNQLTNSESFTKKPNATIPTSDTSASIKEKSSETKSKKNSPKKTAIPKSDSNNFYLSYDASADSCVVNEAPSPNADCSNGEEIILEKSMQFLNEFLIRSFEDFFTHQQWIDKILRKLQNKINTIKTPFFMEELTVTDLDLGNKIPLLKDTKVPWKDEKGLWTHIELNYDGGLKISLATKLNLMSLKKLKSFDPSMGNINDFVGSFHRVQRVRHIGITDSDAEDSPESSGDEMGSQPQEEEKGFEGSPKFMKIVGKIATSSYFQKVTENKYVKMAMENVSNTQLLLTVELKRISGTLALNIPPSPSDRLWYGFIENPTLDIVVKPQVGEKELSYSAVTDWIADRLKLEFQKVFVFPNMDDFYIPLLKSEVNL